MNKRGNNKLTVPVGQVSGILLMVFGGLASAIFGLVVFILFLLGIGIGKIFYVISLFFLPFLGAGIVMIVVGSRINSRLKRFNKYIYYMKGKNYCLIRDLASLTGLSNNYIARDLHTMIMKGMFPQGHIDKDGTWFMLTNETYKQYLELQERHKEKMALENKKEALRSDKLTKEMVDSIEEGRKLVLEIKEANVALPGEEITSKLNKLEAVTDKIFDHVENHPEKFNEINKFTDYFLPTSLKLVESYRKLEGQPVQGNNITSAKKEIEDTLDTINLAFENLLDSLFQDMAMDISTDISVLETMFIQEGLTRANMNVNHETMEEKNE